MGRGWQPQADVDNAATVRERVATTVRTLRQEQRRSLQDLAEAAGIGKSTLHAIESGDANPGIETLWALARALEVPFGALLEPPAPQIRVVRAGEGPRVDNADATMRARLLASSAHGSRVELYAIHLSPPGGREAEPHSAGTVEHVLAISGRLSVGPAESPVELAPGDYASFAADRAHRYDALDDDVEAVMLIEYP